MKCEVSPGVTPGGGLKLSWVVTYWNSGGVSPGVTPGGGLKLHIGRAVGHRIRVSPGVTPGGGLKPRNHERRRTSVEFPPGSHLGAD